MVKSLFTFTPAPVWSPDAPGSTPPVVEPPATPPVTPPVTPPTTREQVPTLLETPPADKQAAAPADFPADWREKMAVGADGKVDAKALERLKRFPSPAELTRSYLEADNKIRTGKANADEPMPEDPEKAKAWRAERSIPDDPTGYVIPDEVKTKLVDEDKPVLASYTAAMHKAGMPQSVVAQGVAWYVSLQEQQAEAINAADKQQQSATEESLRKEWGADYKGLNTVAQRYATEAMPGVDWYKARLPDGRALGNVPEVVKALAKFGIAEYGDVAFAGGEQAVATDNRMKELKGKMDSNIEEWNAHPEWRSEYYKLLEASEKRQNRAG